MTEERREAAKARRKQSEKAATDERAPRGAQRRPIRDAAQNKPAEKRDR